MSKTWGWIRIGIGIKKEGRIRLRIRIGIKKEGRIRLHIRIGIKKEGRIRLRIRIGIGTIPILNTETITRAKKHLTLLLTLYSLGTLYLWKLKQNHLHARVDVKVSWMMKSFNNKKLFVRNKRLFLSQPEVMMMSLCT